jgi:triosephosphate isomerase
MRKKMIAGNWKMNKVVSEVPDFFRVFSSACGLSKDRNVSSKIDILFAVPSVLLDACRITAAGMGIQVAAQNIHQEFSGAYTGEVSLPMLSDIGINATLIGHSERRQYFGETNLSVAQKAASAQKAGFLSVVCFGETLDQRNAGQTEAVIKDQLDPVFDIISGLNNIVLAYEPVWAIGTGVSATSAQAQSAHEYIRNLARARFGSSADSLRILYGGSANSKNIGELLTKPDIDGALIGGASLKPDEIGSMVVKALDVK